MTKQPTGVNVHTQEFLEDPNSALGCPHARLRHSPGTSGPEFYGFETVRGLFRDKRVRPKNVQVYLDMGVAPDSPIIDFLRLGNTNMMATEDHDRLRPIVMKGFRPSRIKAASSVIRNIAADLVEAMISRGTTADLVGDFSHHLSIRSISAFIGVPPDEVSQFEHATVELILLGTVPFLPGVSRLEKALLDIHAYITSLIQRRRREPAEDFLTDLIRLADAGEKLSQDELVWSVVFLLLSGHDTTRSQIASTARALIESGTWERAATEDGFLDRAVKESMRFYPASYRFPRLAREELTVEDLDFSPGDLLSVNLAGAARDPEHFEQPDVFNVDRQENYDIGFGYGPHHCIGWALATAEIVEGAAELTSRLTNVQITGEVTYEMGGVIAGPAALPVSYQVRA